MSDSLRPHELQHARFPCPSLSLRDCSNSCSLSQWCHPTISSSVTPHLPLLSSLPASGSLPKVDFCIRWSKYWSFSLGFSSSSEYSELISFRIDWFDLFKVQGTLFVVRVFPSTTVQKHQFFSTQPSLWSNSHIHTWLLEKTIALTRWTFFAK